MRKSISKVILAATFALAMTSTAFAEGFRVGFYGALPSGTMTAFTSGGSVGALVDLGNRLEVGLGLALISSNQTTEVANGNNTTTTESGDFGWEIIPGVSYTITQKDLVSWGAGLNIYLASSSHTDKSGGQSTTTKPDGVDMAFFPNFFIKAEVVKNFAIGLKPGFVIAMPGKIVTGQSPNQTTRSTTTMGLTTELFLSLYL